MTDARRMEFKAVVGTRLVRRAENYAVTEA